jgi:DNA-binding ferritin-like protein
MVSSHNDSYKKKLKVLFQPNIRLDSETRHSVLKILNFTLADEVLLSMKTRVALSIANGAGSFNRRILFDQHKQLIHISNQITERALVMGDVSIDNFKELFNSSRLDEQSGDAPSMISLSADHEAIIRYLRDDAEKCLKEHGDPVTRKLLMNILFLQEKMVWTLHSYIENKLVYDKS